MACDTVFLHRIRPERNEQRFYRLEVVVDLFGTTLLRRQWGRIGTDGRTRETPFVDPQIAADALDRLATSKRRRGYWRPADH